MRWRCFLGRLARRLADRWAPQPIRVEQTRPGGSWQIYVHDVQIASVGPGMVRDQWIGT